MVNEGQTLTLSSVGLKDQISSIKLNPWQSLQYWTWNQDSMHDRGIIYRTEVGYESTNNQNLNPEVALDYYSNDNFDVVRCDNFSRWTAVLYADPNRNGRRFYLNPGVTLQHLAPVQLLGEISSVKLRPGTLLYYLDNTSQPGWILKDYNNQYTSSAGGADNTPEYWLGTNDAFAQVLASVTMPVYIQRHGVTTNGIDITPAGQTALQAAWNTADCRLISPDTQLYYLSSSDYNGTQRYVQTAQIVKNTLDNHCPNTTVTLNPIPVAHLSSFTAAQASAVMDMITLQNDGTTRIFVLGSFLLHKLAEGNDCGGTPCYLQQWPTFMTLWNASRALQTCRVGFDNNVSSGDGERRYMYNNIYRVQRFFEGGTTNPACMSSIRVPVDNYGTTGCATEQLNYDAANTCPVP